MHAFAEHLRDKAELHPNLALHVVYDQPGPDDRLGATHHSEGQIDRALLNALLPLNDYEVYLCGPGGFMQAAYDALLSLGVRDARIHFESFGPASITRQRELAPDTGSSEAVVVEFVKSGKNALWRPNAGSLLDLAEASGLAPLYSCRSGTCGTCSARVAKGSVDYPDPPAHDIAEGEALICVAHPHAEPHLEDGTLNREGVTLDL